MKFFHLSHTDLDGYGCQLISKQYMQNGIYYNANYGIEVKISLKNIINSIKELDKNEDIFILISDLNLTYEESKELDNNVTKFIKDGYSIELQLLDHHGSGKRSSEIFDWYMLDTSRSATKIVYDYFNHKKEFSDEIKLWIEPLVEAINAVDLWHQDDIKEFEFGKVCMRLVSKAHEINTTLFPNENRDYRLSLLYSTKDYINQNNGYIKLDDQIHQLKKDYLTFSTQNDTIGNLTANHLVHLLKEKKDDLTVFYGEHKGLLTYTLGSISIPANAFLVANDDYHFFIDISRRGTSSIRANGHLNVAKLASKLAKGGGHPNASGCKFKDFKETINYDEVKNFLQSKLDNI